MDETTVNSHMRLRKAWSNADKPVNTLIGRKRYGGITIYGAIGNCLKSPVFMLGESKNIEEFEEFMKKVKLTAKKEMISLILSLTIIQLIAVIESSSISNLTSHSCSCLHIHTSSIQ